MLWVFNAICNNIAIISWRSFLLVEDTGVLGEKYKPTCQRSLTDVVTQVLIDSAYI